MFPPISSGPSGVANGHHQARSGGSKAPWGMKMQAGSACLHWALAGMHWPLLQKFPVGQLTFAQAVGCVTGWAALQTPVSSWQVPSPQSASLLQRPLPPGAAEQSAIWGSHVACDFLSTHASRQSATSSETVPRPIPTSPNPAGKVVRWVPGGKLPGVRQETFATMLECKHRSNGPLSAGAHPESLGTDTEQVGT
jgi:hypothetical protein